MVRLTLVWILFLVVAVSLQAQPARRTFGSTFLDWDMTEKAVFMQSAIQIYLFAALDGCHVPEGGACKAAERLKCFNEEEPVALSMRFAGYLRDRPEAWDTNLGLLFARWAQSYCRP